MRWVPPPKPWRCLTEEDAQKGARVQMTANSRSNNEAKGCPKEFWMGWNEETGTTKRDSMLAIRGMITVIEYELG